MPGQLFTEYFLTEGIKQTPEWQQLLENPEVLQELRDVVDKKFNKNDLFDQPNEPTTEQELIRPVLEVLGWRSYLPQQSASGGEDIPDYLLFSDEAAKTRAAAESSGAARFRHATVVLESKRRELPLDSRETTGRSKIGRTPHRQILRYLSTADVESDGNIRWGILTNGAAWRLYDHRTRPRATAYYEANLEKIVRTNEVDELRIFYLLFNRDSFILHRGNTTTFLETALLESKRYEEQVAEDISGLVFDDVFPNLVGALAKASNEKLDEVHRAALIFLYRILFILYAEDRGLLPIRDRRYFAYSMRSLIRDDIRDKMMEGITFSSNATKYQNILTTLFRMIEKGDASIGIPPYNGGLFSNDAAPLLSQVQLDDETIAPIIYTLSHTHGEGGLPRFINYRDMSVQQLGSIYERLLEQQPIRTPDGFITIRANPYARKDSGSFFTPQELINLILEHTLDPLVEELFTTFEAESSKLENDPRPKNERLAELRKIDPAQAILDLKVLDPAMGSGHFLVTAVDILSDYIADFIDKAQVVPEWLDEPYVSPLADQIENIRSEIMSRAKDKGWRLYESQLTDQTIIRRMVLKRCIYGVDKNPLTVELAKVSLWLHSFTVGIPLTFLDHHLRCGDSLVGMQVNEMLSDLERLGGINAASAMQGLQEATSKMRQIETISDADIVEVEKSTQLFNEVEKSTAELRKALDFTCGIQWMTAGLSRHSKSEIETPISNFLTSTSRDVFNLIVSGTESGTPSSNEDSEDGTAFNEIWRQATRNADAERFQHWEAVFPSVWNQWQDDIPQGGFDAIIGNPPWDRIKLQEVEWFATREPEIALERTAAARRRAINELMTNDSQLAQDFETAKAHADKFSNVIRNSGDYPLLGRGDINLYSLFVERAMHLIKPNGLVGLLVPSGIYGDLTAAEFFKKTSTNGQVHNLFDFENRKIFFKDVHASFKFSALILGGENRTVPETRCAFFLHDTVTINDRNRCFTLTPDDFSRVNPNTGTAPIFRTRRDADITRDIYQKHPVLVDRSGKEERRTWPVRYSRMIDMTNDSRLFRTANQLKTEGFYPVGGNRFKKRDEIYVPLYEGKMVQAYDHRAASVVVNPNNLNRPAVTRPTALYQHEDPYWEPTPQFWVSEGEIDWVEGLNWAIGFKDATASTNSRSMIAAIIGKTGIGNTLPLLTADAGTLEMFKKDAPLLLSCLNSFAYDFVARQKIQGQHLNLYIVEQIPVIFPDAYSRQFGHRAAFDIVKDHVARLTYTSYDMQPFARDLGYQGHPLPWDPEERRHLRARLDALYFHLYGISNEDAEYILNTFPIVRSEDERKFGRFRTCEMIISYMNALAADDPDVQVDV